jgi:hypothetical protein
MTDKPDAKRWRWKHWGCAFLGALVLYVISFIPVVLIAAWLVEWNVLPMEGTGKVLSTVYAPLEWIDHYPAARRAFESVTDPFKPLLPGHQR